MIKKKELAKVKEDNKPPKKRIRDRKRTSLSETATEVHIYYYCIDVYIQHINIGSADPTGIVTLQKMCAFPTILNLWKDVGNTIFPYCIINFP